MNNIEDHFGKGGMHLLEPSLYDDLLFKRFTIKDLEDITYRTINHWDEKGLLLIGERQNGASWRKFSFYEYIWIKVLAELRDMGVSVEIVVPKILKKLGYRHQTEDNAENRPVSDEKIEIIGEAQWEFARHILIALVSKLPLVIQIFKNGECSFYKGISINGSPEKIASEVNEFSKSAISISVTDIIKKFVGDKDFETVSSLSVLNENELELLKHLRRDEVSELTVKLAEGNIKSFSIKDKPAIFDKGKRIEDFIVSPYQEISFQTVNGKTVSFERTTKIKL